MNIEIKVVTGHEFTHRGKTIYTDGIDSNDKLLRILDNGVTVALYPWANILRVRVWDK